RRRRVEPGGGSGLAEDPVQVGAADGAGGLGLAELALPYLNTISGKQLYVPYENTMAWVAAIAITLFTGVVAGSYPALFLSSFRPVKVLKGIIKTGSMSLRPRQILVVLQFSFAITLIIGTILIYKQIGYIKSKPVGYDRDGLVEMELEGKMYEHFERFRTAGIDAGAIADGVTTSGGITSSGASSWGVEWPSQKPGEDKIPIDMIATNYHFISTFGVKLSEGRDFSPAHPSDSLSVIVNESAVKLMRLQNPVGQKIRWQGQQRTIVGVVKDFVWGSPYEPTKPMIIGFWPEWAGSVSLRLNPTQSVSQSLAKLEKIYKSHNPGFPFEYRFIDSKFAEKFKTETLLGTIGNWFSGLAIFVSCLGLFGLAAFAAEQRKKEIGIRKVLGASVSVLWFNLSSEFLKLVAISFIIGSVAGWWLMSDWLSRYTYRTSIGFSVFARTGLVAIIVTLATISWQAIRAALVNPANTLRSE
ncbi:MAG: FtsX-like permease family protein, partial [Pedobacter sp.]